MPTTSLPPDPYSLLPQVPAFTLASDDAQDGKPLHASFAHSWATGCEDISPELHWTGFPEQTRSFAVTLYNPDAATGSGFWHWMPVGLPANTTALRRGAGIGSDLPKGAFQIRNDLGGKNYLGLAPPPHDRSHRYVFAAHALDVAALAITDDMTPAFIGFHMAPYTLARAPMRLTFAL